MRIEISITPADVKAEAARRLADIDWRVEKAKDQQNATEERRLRALRQSIRAASNEIERMSPIPQDYRDKKHWPR